MGGCKKIDGTAITVTIQEDAIIKIFGTRFAIPLNFDFVKCRACPYGLKEDLTARLEFDSSEKIILFSEDVAVTYRLPDIRQYLVKVV